VGQEWLHKWLQEIENTLAEVEAEHRRRTEGDRLKVVNVSENADILPDNVGCTCGESDLCHSDSPCPTSSLWLYGATLLWSSEPNLSEYIVLV